MAKKLTAVSGSANKALLAEVIANPEDDLPRMVYADWLQQRGDPRGELITLQLAGKAKLADALLKKHKKAWAPKLGSYVYARGFAVLYKVAVDKFPAHAAAVFAAEPIRTLDLSQGNALDPTPDVRPAFTRKELARVRRLELRRLRIPVDVFPKVVATKALAELRELDLGYAAMSKSSVEALLQKSVFTRLEVLRLYGCRLDDRFALALAAAPFANSLRDLDIGLADITAPGMMALAALPSLNTLRIAKCKVDKGTKTVLAKRFGKGLVV